MENTDFQIKVETVAMTEARASAKKSATIAKSHAARQQGRSDWVPGEKEIDAMIPRVVVEHQAGKCDREEPVLVKEIVGRRGKSQTIQITICSEEAMAKEIKRDVAKGLREARSEALESLIEARSDIESNEDIPDHAKNEILARFTNEIARLRSPLG